MARACQKMKRSLEKEEAEAATIVGNTEDLWINGIFPLFYGMSFVWWMKLQTVSKGWYQMIRGWISELIIDIKYKNDFSDKCAIIGKRFCGEKLIKLTAHSQEFLYSVGKSMIQPTLKKLVLLSGGLSGLSMEKLAGLTHLELKKKAYIPELELLTNLTHLSMMHLNDLWVPSDKQFLSKLPLLEHLCMARNGSLPHRRVIMSHYLPLPPQNNLKYIESDSYTIFSGYKGVGKVWYSDKTYYVGAIEGSKRHGMGENVGKKGVYRGIWNNGNLRNGIISYKNGISYEGDIVEYRPNGFGTLKGREGQEWCGTFKGGKPC
jgi:hypothetical protein